MTKSKFSALFMVVLGIFILFASAALAYANYFDIIPIDKTIEKVSEQLPWNQEEEVLIVRPAAHPTATPFVEEKPELTKDEMAYNHAAASETFVAFPETTYTYTEIENTNCMSKPDSGYVIQTLTSGDHVKAVGTDGEYLVIHCGDSIYGYAKADRFMEGDLYAVVENGIDLRAIMPYAEYRMIWSKENNMIGRSLYPGIPILEEKTALKLWAAYDDFLENGYKLIVYDAYRPAPAQSAIYEVVQDPGYVLNPYESYSWHNVGKAVDISLIEISSGDEVELPTPIYTFDTLSSRNMSDEWTDEAKENVELMTRIMTENGFTPIDTEWWHFEVPLKEEPNLDPRLDYAEITYEPAS